MLHRLVENTSALLQEIHQYASKLTKDGTTLPEKTLTRAATTDQVPTYGRGRPIRSGLPLLAIFCATRGNTLGILTQLKGANTAVKLGHPTRGKTQKGQQINFTVRLSESTEPKLPSDLKTKPRRTKPSRVRPLLLTSQTLLPTSHKFVTVQHDFVYQLFAV